VDGDRPDMLRMVRAARDAKEICGLVLVSRPDFEFGNFTRGELQQVLLKFSRLHAIPEKHYRKLREATNAATTPSELWGAAHRITGKLPRFGKGQEWGQLLVRLANESPSWTTSNGTDKRPLVRAITEAVRSVILDYRLSREHGPLILGELDDKNTNSFTR